MTLSVMVPSILSTDLSTIKILDRWIHGIHQPNRHTIPRHNYDFSPFISDTEGSYQINSVAQGVQYQVQHHQPSQGQKEEIKPSS